jgi:hypothetical protein
MLISIVCSMNVLVIQPHATVEQRGEKGAGEVAPSGLQHHLDAAILLVPELLVELRSFGQRRLVGDCQPRFLLLGASHGSGLLQAEISSQIAGEILDLRILSQLLRLAVADVLRDANVATDPLKKL